VTGLLQTSRDMCQASQTGKRWQKRALAALLVLTVTLLACAGVRHWLATSRISVQEVDELIKASLREGASRQEVEDWLLARSLVNQDRTDGTGRRIIQSWIPNSGPRGEFLWVRDIRLQFFFDGDDRLVKYTVVEEDRF
jgi:hypothetical protein